MVALLIFISDVHSMELKAAQGLKFVTAFYWDRDAESRAWSKRFFDKQGRMPTMAQAGVYSAVRHYLMAIAAAGTDEAKAVMAKMRAIPVNDFYVRNGQLREDGRLVHDMYFPRSRRRRNPPSRGTITRCSASFRAIRHSVRWRTAVARWWRVDAARLSPKARPGRHV